MHFLMFPLALQVCVYFTGVRKQVSTEWSRFKGKKMQDTKS